MEAKLLKHGEITVVQLSGQLDVENSQNFHVVCMQTFSRDKVVFCLEGLKFVGSSGIQTFFRTLGEVHKLNPYGIRISGVKPDFQRVLQYTSLAQLEVHPSIENAVISFALGRTEIAAPVTMPDFQVDEAVEDAAEERNS